MNEERRDKMNLLYLRLYEIKYLNEDEMDELVNL